MQNCQQYATHTTSYGSRGFDVQKLQMFLNAYEGSVLPVTGYFGPLTRSAVQSFQARYNIRPTTGNQFEKTTDMINALYCRPALNETTIFISIVPIFANHQEMIVHSRIMHTQTSAHVSSKTPTIPTITVSRSEPENTVVSTDLKGESSPIDSDVYEENMERSYGLFSFHNLIPWLMLLAALLLAYLALRTYRGTTVVTPIQNQKMLGNPSNVPVIIPPVKSAVPIIVTSAASNTPLATSVTSSDNLVKIEGIGPAANKILRDAGVRSFAQLAAMNTDVLRSIFLKAWPHFNEPSLNTWVEQAALARDGKWDQLALLNKKTHTFVQK